MVFGSWYERKIIDAEQSRRARTRDRQPESKYHILIRHRKNPDNVAFRLMGADRNEVLAVLHTKLTMGGDKSTLAACYIDFREVSLEDMKMSWLDAPYADFRGIKMSSTDLRGTNLSNARFDGARMWYAHLEGADLRFASFRDVDLTSTKLDGANLDGADLTGAKISPGQLAKITGKPLNILNARRIARRKTHRPG